MADVNQAQQTPQGGGDIPVFQNNPVMILVYELITCGLYGIYWNKKVAEVMNAVAGREVISPTIALVSGCCAPVNIYFYYLCSQCLGDLGKRIGKEEELKSKGTMLLVLGILFMPVAAMILQGHINELYGQPQA